MGEVDLRGRVADRSYHSGSKATGLVEQRRRPDSDTIGGPMRVALHTNPFTDG